MRPPTQPPMRIGTPALFAGIVAASLAISPLRAPAQRTPSGDEARVVATIEELFKATARGDMAALDTLYAGDSLTVVEGAGINRGWADYRDHHLGPELKEMKNFQYRPFEIEAHVAGGTTWAMFRYTLRATMGERALDLVGRGTAILERRGERWVVRHKQTSNRPRRPADPPVP